MSAKSNKNALGRKATKLRLTPSFSMPADPELRREVALRAVIPSLLVRQSLVGDEAKDKASEALREIWHEAAKGLFKTGVLDELQLRRALECPALQGSPASDLHARSCFMYRLCPMCWGRFAAQVWVDIDKRMFPADRTTGSAAASELDLVEVRRHYTVPPRVRHGMFDEDAPVAAAGARWGDLPVPSLQFRAWAQEVRSIRSEGVIENMSFAPDPFTGYWDITLSQLFIMDPSQDFRSPAVRGRNQSSRHPNPTREAVAAAVSRTFRYPPDLLDANPDAMRVYMEANELGTWHFRIRTPL